jgi:hypothetical protein
MNEKEMRERKAVSPNSFNALKTEIGMLLNNNNDYGQAVYAISLACVATFNFMAKELGITGFQASCADLDILRRTRRMENGFKILNFDRLLYPQYVDEFNITYEKLLSDNIENLSLAAKKKLEEMEDFPAHPDVVKHWEKISKRTV